MSRQSEDCLLFFIVVKKKDFQYPLFSFRIRVKKQAWQKRTPFDVAAFWKSGKSKQKSTAR
jgi:hypothetical protein